MSDEELANIRDKHDLKSLRGIHTQRAKLLAEVDRLRAQVEAVEHQRDLAFRDGTIEATEAILMADFIGGSSYTLEKRVRERLAEYRASRSDMAPA